MFALLLAASIAADPTENMYRTAKTGDWIEWKTNDVVMRQTVTAKTDATLTLRIEQTIDGKKGPPLDQFIDLKGPFPPVRKAEPKDETKTDVEELGTGKETLTVGGKTYDCTWAKRKTTITFKGGITFVSVTKGWNCPDVPLGGAVRMETEIQGKTSVTEMTGSGRGK